MPLPVPVLFCLAQAPAPVPWSFAASGPLAVQVEAGAHGQPQPPALDTGAAAQLVEAFLRDAGKTVVPLEQARAEGHPVLRVHLDPVPAKDQRLPGLFVSISCAAAAPMPGSDAARPLSLSFRMLVGKDLDLQAGAQRLLTGMLQVLAGAEPGPGAAGGPSRPQADAASGILEFPFRQVHVLLQPPPPPYPPLAKIAKIQGTVVVRLTIGTDGVPVEAEALSGPAQLMDTAARYAMDWRFEPLLEHGRPILARFRLTMPFMLR